MTDTRAEIQPTETDRIRRRGATGGYIATLLLAIVLAIFGFVLLAGGVWLIALGGSWYYAIAGLGLCATAWFLGQPAMPAFWIYLATYGFTVVWAFWEKGGDWWAQVPRLVAPSVVLILVLLTLPVLKSGKRGR